MALRDDRTEHVPDDAGHKKRSDFDIIEDHLNLQPPLIDYCASKIEYPEAYAGVKQLLARLVRYADH